MREQVGLSLLHVSSAWPHGHLIFHVLLKRAVSIYGEMQTGVEGAADRGRVNACCAPWPGHDGEKTPGTWLARNALVLLSACGHGIARKEPIRPVTWQYHGIDVGLHGEDAFALAKADLSYWCRQQQQAGLARMAPAAQACCQTILKHQWAPGCQKKPGMPLWIHYAAAVPLSYPR